MIDKYEWGQWVGLGLTWERIGNWSSIDVKVGDCRIMAWIENNLWIIEIEGLDDEIGGILVEVDNDSRGRILMSIWRGDEVIGWKIFNGVRWRWKRYGDVMINKKYYYFTVSSVEGCFIVNIESSRLWRWWSWWVWHQYCDANINLSVNNNFFNYNVVLLLL